MDVSLEPGGLIAGEREEDEDAQNMMKMLDISDHLVCTKKSGPFDLMDNPVERKYVREGVLKKMTRGPLGGKDRKAFLFTDVLLVTEEKQQKNQTRVYEIGRVLPLKGAKLITGRHMHKKQNHFYVVVHSGSADAYEVEFGTSSPEDRDSWLRDIKELIMDELGKDDGSELCDYAQHHKLLEGTLSNAVVTGDQAKVLQMIMDADKQEGIDLSTWDCYS